MSDSDAKLLVLHGFSPEGDTWLSFREPNETQIAGLCKRLVEDRYDKPFLVENRKTRSLCFGIDGAVQSEMWLDDPESLVSAYTRKMMGFLLFRRRPREVLMIGLGGGSLTKFCHRHLPSARMTVIEIDPGVIALRSHFQIPPDDSRLRVINGDGSAYVAAMAQSNQRTDVLLVDAFDRHGIATAVTERAFLQDARCVLSRRGIFVMNLVATLAACKRYIDTIRSVFGGPVIAVKVDNDSNVVVFAGRPLLNRRRLVAATHNARQLEGRHGLSFPTLLRLTRELQYQLLSRGDPWMESPAPQYD
jgi:spermidine synthase